MYSFFQNAVAYISLTVCYVHVLCDIWIIKHFEMLNAIYHADANEK